MSAIPNSAIPHPVDPALASLPDPERKPRRGPLSQALRVLAAPSLVVLGLGVLAFEGLRRAPRPAVPAI